jgi:hypothetical protein
MDGGQFQSSFSRLHGSKERLEQAGKGFGVHAATRVANCKPDPGIAKLVARVASYDRPIAVSRADGDSAAVRHGIARV